MEPKDLIAVAQVYATLVQARVTAASAQKDISEVRGFLDSALRYEQKALNFLKLAGVTE